MRPSIRTRFSCHSRLLLRAAFAAPLLAVLSAGVPAQAEHVSFEGEVGTAAGKDHFEKALPGGILFTMRPEPGSKDLGDWQMSILDAGRKDTSQLDYIYLFTPSQNFQHPTDFSPRQYGRLSAYRELHDRSFCFLADKSRYDDVAKATDAMMWPVDPKSGFKNPDEAKAALHAMPKGSGTLTVLDAKIADKDYRSYAQSDSTGLPITYFKFRVDIDIPASTAAKDCL